MSLPVNPVPQAPAVSPVIGRLPLKPRKCHVWTRAPLGHIAAASSGFTEFSGRNGDEEEVKQVRGSSGQAREALRRHFTELQAAASRLLTERLIALLAEVDSIEADSIKPLDDCQSLIEHGVGQADELLREALVDVPCVSAQLDDSLLGLLRERVSRHGAVSSCPPVQIDELQERPGGILVRWCKVDEDFAAADYRLQHRRSGTGGSQYEDSYIGRDCEFLVLQVDPHTDYLFRVCARGEGRTEWSPWSIPQTGYTTLAPHGAVFVNGKEMTNQLPAIATGSAVTFDMEVVNLFPVSSSNNNLSDGCNFKLRVTIGSGSREVVFDWLVDQAVDGLFFGCSFVHSGWKVLVF
ncbi:hypothetical protein F2P81_015507 [Scophthalmus maximus]|uniref:Cytokine receptor-like factor 3 n=1 Tax=Scophthalmus maximus TaxID=52904 RepID=A0A6A4SIY4_SCOMX|nr:hypothetical protein F2P81_015507 [Scophthalmus maximus]